MSSSAPRLSSPTEFISLMKEGAFGGAGGFGGDAGEAGFTGFTGSAGAAGTGSFGATGARGGFEAVGSAEASTSASCSSCATSALTTSSTSSSASTTCANWVIEVAWSACLTSCWNEPPADCANAGLATPKETPAVINAVASASDAVTTPAVRAPFSC